MQTGKPKANDMHRILLIFLCFFSGCIGRTEKTKILIEDDNFYIDKGSYDAVRVPLLRPYELLRLNGSSEWVVSFSKRLGTASDVKRISVQKPYILIQTGETACNQELIKNGWFFFNVIDSTEKCFAYKSDFDDFVKTYNIQFRDSISPNEAFEIFNKEGTVPWK